jgi:hypothetical protein
MLYKVEMIRSIVAAIFFILSVSVGEGTDNTSVAVTITKKTPMETLSPTGDVIGVTEATVGARLNLVSANGAEIMLQDAQGIHYRIALSSTDYNPPVAVSSTSTNSPTQIGTPRVVAKAAVAPVQAVSPTPSLPTATMATWLPLLEHPMKAGVTKLYGEQPKLNKYSL